MLQGLHSTAVAGLIALALSAQAPGANAAQEADTPGERGVRPLVQSMRSGDSAQDVARRLRALGLRAMPALFDVWSKGLDGQALREQEVLVVRGAVLALPGRQVVTFLEDTLVPSEGSPRSRQNALDVFAELGDATDIGYMVLLGSYGHGERNGRALENALAMIAARDPRAFDRLRAEWTPPDEWLTPYLLRAVGQSGQRDGLRVLAPWLFGEGCFTAEVLSQVGNIAQRVGPPFADALVSGVRSHLYSEDVGVRAQATRATGLLGDVTGMSRLIKLLASSAAQVRSEALSSLQLISGRTFGADTKRWRSWYLGELAWWEGSWPALREGLHSAEPAEFAQAIRAVVRRRLFRDLVAEELAPLLFDADPLIRRLACQGLGQLGSHIPLDQLVDCLYDQEEDVGLSAHQALLRLTSHELPMEPNAWRAALGEHR